MKVAVHTIKGGVGKTTTLMLLGFSLAAFYNKRVLFLDTDLQGDLSFRLLPNYYELSVESTEQSGLGRAAVRSIQPQIYRVLDNLFIAPMEPDAIIHVRQSQVFQTISKMNFNDFDFVLIDTPPSYDKDFISQILASVDAIFGVVAPSVQSIKSIVLEYIRVLPRLASEGVRVPKVLGIVENDVYPTTSNVIAQMIDQINELCMTVSNIKFSTPCMFASKIIRRASYFNYDTIKTYLKRSNRYTTYLLRLLEESGAKSFAGEVLERAQQA